MKGTQNHIFNQLLFLKKKIRVFRTFNKRHKGIFNNGEFSKTSLTSLEKQEYLDYWKRFGKNVNLTTVVISKSLSGIFDKRIVPEEIFELYIQPKIQNISNASFLANKNIYNKWFDEGIFPQDFLHKINGAFYDSKLNPVKDFEEFFERTDFDFPVVFKPSIDTSGGANVFFLGSKREILDRITHFENLVIQEKITQHPEINEIYSQSLNSIRVCLLRNPFNSEITVLNTSLRMGKNGSLDNETAGGIVCYINEKGKFNSFAVDRFGKKYLAHPNSNKVFEGELVPYYDQLIETSIRVAEQVVYAGLISLDMCLDSQGKWRCIEVNLKYQTIRFSQYAGVPFFGNLTDEVIEYCTK